MTVQSQLSIEEIVAAQYPNPDARVEVRLRDVEDLLRERQRVRELEAALADVCDLAIWMSGSDSFAPDGEAHEGWVKQREKLDAALTLADSNRRNRPEEK